MSGNGRKSAPVARVEMLTPVASPSEAAAIVAAVEQFIAETAPVVDAVAPAQPWQRAALEEGIAARQVSGYAWGHAPRAHGNA